MIALLRLHWRPDNVDENRGNASLAIVAGQYGSRLSHSHRMQYYFVLQSLLLWQEVSGVDPVEGFGRCCLVDDAGRTRWWESGKGKGSLRNKQIQPGCGEYSG